MNFESMIHTVRLLRNLALNVNDGLIDVIDDRNCDDLITLCEKADKYRWHDLRKNPDDVPTHNDKVLIAIEWQGGSIDYYTDRYIDGGWIRDNFLRFGKIIAWKEVEPFMEGENK